MSFSDNSESTANVVFDEYDLNLEGPGREALDELLFMDGYEIESGGFSIGDEPEDTFYAIENDFDDVNGKIFLKTTNQAMIEGNVEEDEKNEKNFMTAQEVLKEIKEIKASRR